jgi:hypothetical protein
MSKFTILLGGRGSEVSVHSITEEQKEKLEHLNLDECAMEDVIHILNFDDESSLIETNEVYIGVYPEHSRITVFDENNNEVIFNEDVEKLIMEEMISDYTQSNEIYQPLKLYVNDYIKGTPFMLDVDGDEPFDIKKLEFNYTDIEGMEMISSFKYNGVESEFGDYWSKGLTYFLSNE